ncbi:MAG: hypothetical protein ACKORE_08355, partial [Bacteroidota bacterium]
MSWISPSGGGTVTSVATGSGLTGGPITGSGTVSVATGGIANSMIADGAVTSAKILDGTIANVDMATGSVNSSTIADGSISTADMADNSVNGSKLAMGSDALGDMLVYNGTDYVRLAAGTNGQILKMSGGSPVWSNPTGLISNVLVNNAAVVTPTSTLGFISPTVSVTIATGQRVLLDVTCGLGAGATAANALNIAPGYKLTTGTT